MHASLPPGPGRPSMLVVAVECWVHTELISSVAPGRVNSIYLLMVVTALV